MEKTLAVCLLIKHCAEPDEIERAKELLKKTYDTERVFVITGADRNDIIITDLNKF